MGNSKRSVTTRLYFLLQLLRPCDRMLKTLKENGLSMRHFLLAVPQQMNIHVGNTFAGRQAPERTVVEIHIQQMLRQATDAETGDHQPANFFKA